MAPSETAYLRTREVAIDVPSADLPEQHLSGPCKELKDLFMSKAPPGTGTSSRSAEARARALIQRVPRYLRDNEKKKGFYDPMLVSVGPYHYGDPKLEVGQTLKARLMKRFAAYVDSTSKGSKSLESCFHSPEFSKVAREARELYASDSKLDELNEEAFKCLMFLDGCFLVYFFSDELDFEDPQMNINLNFIQRDILLLENQIPYIVLQLLVKEFLPKEDYIEEYVKSFARIEGSPGRVSPLCGAVGCCFKPILDFARTTLQQNDSSSSTAMKKETPLHLLDYVRTHLLGDELCPSSSDIEKYWEGKYWESFRSAYELRSAGIKCVTSGSSTVDKIRYTPCYFNICARLSLPPIIIHGNFKPLWLNLLAYEACPDFPNDAAIASFICFMDSLIDHPEDVKELRRRGVLLNALGSDEQVADLFNEMAEDLSPNPLKYYQVTQQIEKHFNNKLAIWIAGIIHDHFSTPWAGIAFVAAILVVFLTFVQTYYTVFPRNT